MDSSDVTKGSGLSLTNLRTRSRFELVQWALQLAVVFGLGGTAFYVSARDGQYVSMAVSVLFVLWGLPILYNNFRTE
ncbi:MAG: hypothetical protein ABEI98_09695 [Halorhabdus sp.]